MTKIAEPRILFHVMYAFNNTEQETVFHHFKRKYFSSIKFNTFLYFLNVFQTKVLSGARAVKTIKSEGCVQLRLCKPPVP